MNVQTIGNAPLDLNSLRQLLNSEALRLSPEAAERIQNCRRFLDEKIAASNSPFYGINTGFGSLCDVQVEADELNQLQDNLVMSHACGTGEQVPQELVRLMLLLKVQSLSYGHSGVQLATVQRLLDFYNEGIYPVVYQQGSLGASGDLAPLAHLSLPLLGLGEVHYQGQQRPAAEVLEEKDWEPIRLQSKEGIALLNGTQFSLAYGLWAAMHTEKLLDWADFLAALSADAFACVLSPFDERLHAIRPHAGQQKTAANIRRYLANSPLAAQPKDTVQDPYAFRCVPQVHGASRDAFVHVLQVLQTEMNSVTDNPNIFPDSDAILSGGNFHAQPLALSLDFLAIALSEIGSISERRVYQLISGKRGLPPFLTLKWGLHSGYMIPQYTAASIASQNKQLCTPASVDSIISCNGQEDHVSMAANAGTKLYKVVENVGQLLGIELMVGSQALDCRDLPSSDVIQKVVSDYRKRIPTLQEDRVLSADMQASWQFLKDFDLEAAAK